MRIVRHAGPQAFLDRAESWLLRREAENNLPLGVAASLVGKGPAAASARLFYFATVESSGDLVGCAFRTPPYKPVLTRMPMEAVPLVARDMAQVYEELPAVLGPVEVAEAFGAAWSRLKGVRATPGALQRIHVLERVVPPSRKAPGSMRLAGPADIPLVTRWLGSFARETALAVVGGADAAARRLVGADGGDPRLALWVRDDPVAMAGFSGRTRHGVRIGHVYTPERHRRNGYATSLVAEMSRDALDSGFGHCMLYTDLANPTANHIYHEIGYRPVLDVMDVEFEAPAAASQ